MRISEEISPITTVTEYTCMRILLSEKDFEQLVSGKIVKIEDAEVALQDIGYARMIEILEGKLTDLYT